MVAKQDPSLQTAIAIGKLAEAEVAAAEKDEPRVLAALKSVGKGTLEFAKEVGKGVVAEAIKRAMGVE